MFLLCNFFVYTVVLLPAWRINFIIISSLYTFSGSASASFVRTDLVTTISHECLSNLDETYSEYSIAHNNDLIRFLRSKLKVKVTAGRRGNEGIHFDMTRSSFSGYFLTERCLVVRHLCNSLTE